MGYIIIITTLLSLSLWGVFLKGNHTIVKHASNIQQHLQRQINTQKDQIKIRHLHLDTYHFLRYNLNESLQAQLEIKL